MQIVAVEMFCMTCYVYYVLHVEYAHRSTSVDSFPPLITHVKGGIYQFRRQWLKRLRSA